MPRYVVYLIRYVSTIRIVYRIKCIAIRIVSYHPNDTQPYRIPNMVLQMSPVLG